MKKGSWLSPSNFASLLPRVPRGELEEISSVGRKFNFVAPVSELEAHYREIICFAANRNKACFPVAVIQSHVQLQCY